MASTVSTLSDAGFYVRSAREIGENVEDHLLYYRGDPKYPHQLVRRYVGMCLVDALACAKRDLLSGSLMLRRK